MQNLKSLKAAWTALLCLGFLAVAGCRKGSDTDEQSNGRLEVPAFENTVKPGFLTGGIATAEYSGSFIVWNPAVTREQMATVMQASRHYNETFVSQLVFGVEQIAPLEKELDSLTNELKSVQSEKNLALLTARSAAASRWFDDQLADPALAGLDETDRKQAHAVFEAVCEGAIWQKAVSSSFVKSNFVSVPTPLALCRGVYESKGLMQPSAAACAPAETAAGKNYFACLWQEGVAKTGLFQRYGARLSEMQAIDVEALRMALADNILLGDRILKHFPVVIGDKTINFKFDGQVGALDPSLGLANATVDVILTNFKKPLANPHADTLGLISTKRTDRDAAVVPAADKLRDQIRIFWEQLNDSKLNEPILVKAADLNDSSNNTTVVTVDQTPYASIFSSSDAALDEKVAEVQVRVDAKQKELEEKQLLGGPLGAGVSCVDRPENMTCKTKIALEAQADAVQQDGVGLAMISGTELVLHRSENGSLALALTFNNRDTDVRQLRACLNADSGKIVSDDECQWPDRLKQKDDVVSDMIKNLDVSMDKTTGKMSFAFEPKDLTTLGLNPKERQSGQIDFNLIDEQRWQGKRVTFDIYPTELDHVLAIYSGSGKIKDDHESLVTTVSLTSEIRQ